MTPHWCDFIFLSLPRKNPREHSAEIVDEIWGKKEVIEASLKADSYDQMKLLCYCQCLPNHNFRPADQFYQLLRVCTYYLERILNEEKIHYLFFIG
jgi:hypothetical protein